MNEPSLIKQWLKDNGGNIHQMTDRGGEIPAEAMDYEPELISDYEQINGVPYIVDKLQINADYKIDPKIEVKARGIDEFIRKQLNRDSSVSYETILERMTSKLPESLERMMMNKENLKALGIMFNDVALSEEFSGETYIKQLTEQIKYTKVEALKKQLKELLQNV